MTPPVPECTCREPEKAEVWPCGAIPFSPLGKHGNVTSADDLQSADSRISSGVQIFFLF
jgi:hypothetical protein